jgi:hypothetical protein
MMAGFEVIVRPVVFPNIRPAPPRVLAPEDDPEQGIAVISGAGGRLINLPHTWSVSVSRQGPHRETKRQVDLERVYQVDDKGNINKQNFVDVERMKKLRADTKEDTSHSGMARGMMKIEFSDPPPRANVETLETHVTRMPPGSQYIYRPGDD